MLKAHRKQADISHILEKEKKWRDATQNQIESVKSMGSTYYHLLWSKYERSHENPGNSSGYWTCPVVASSAIAWE